MENSNSPSADIEQIRRSYDCSANEMSVIADVLQLDTNKKNPTKNLLIEAMLQSMRESRPLDVWTSQCIGKKPEVRLNKFDYFCKRNEEKPRNVSLPEGAIDAVEAKCWEKLRRIRDAIGARITLLLGDADFFTLDAMDEWASAETIGRLREECDVLLRDTGEKANEYFNGHVSVAGWSAFYDKKDFESELIKAEASKERWLVGKFQRASVRPYMRNWKYPDIAQARGISEQELARFIEGDIIRTAAQYRVESRIVMQRNAVQCWAETCGDPLWPITISDYDKAGAPPSISLM